jgi:hypothetical protein
MRYTSVPVVLALLLAALWAADNITPLNVKEGLWEVTSTRVMTGLPSIPPDTLAKMPAEQRARVEAMMQQSGMGGTPKTEVRRDCVTKEKIEKHLAFDQNKGECTRTVVTSTSSRLEVKFHCEPKDNDKEKMTSDGVLIVETTGSDSAKGSVRAVTTGNGRNINFDVTFSSKYLGSACGDVK